MGNSNNKKRQHRSASTYQYRYWEHPKNERVQKMPVSQLKPFEEQPFKVLLDESMNELVESIKESGVLSPIIARPHKDGGYEILSGHRRAKACEIAGIKNVPVIVKNLDDDTAAILLVDSNLQREHILPSEKAYAYRLKLEAMKRKAGRPSKENLCQVGTNLIGTRSDETIAENMPDSARQIQRYIRLIRITLKEDKLREYFPEEFTPKQMEDTIIELIANWAKTRKRHEPER